MNPLAEQIMLPARLGGQATFSQTSPGRVAARAIRRRLRAVVQDAQPGAGASAAPHLTAGTTVC
ncbi:hypothetical protein [Mycoavidus cysteinexigens]|uniref:hypothetical protein n=1 Tax=Mycoavidus cysteinexigens TaxID=1553431 RepID=UPI001375DCD8|nr:hypothetical protein [Mycoavidus cysteinexigens]GAM52462.1 hypothetical protein EBME_0925 [bacterium endosymbiont of Mortierella elongata FMR23-6]